MVENLAYALTQVLHNFGAVVVVGGAVFALLAPGSPSASGKWLAQLVGLGWALQIASGAGFGAISYYYYGRVPEIHGVAVAALTIKVTCAVVGLALALLLHSSVEGWPEARRRQSWCLLAVLGASALTAAAFLRWFS